MCMENVINISHEITKRFNHIIEKFCKCSGVVVVVICEVPFINIVLLLTFVEAV